MRGSPANSKVKSFARATLATAEARKFINAYASGRITLQQASLDLIGLGVSAEGVTKALGGPITLPEKLSREEEVFSESTSLLFKETKVIRMYDEKRRTLVYVAISKRVVEGSPMNAISTVPVMPWQQGR